MKKQTIKYNNFKARLTLNNVSTNLLDNHTKKLRSRCLHVSNKLFSEAYNDYIHFQMFRKLNGCRVKC